MGNTQAATTDAPPFAPPKVAGYDLYDFLGKGGYGKVWKARSKKTGELVALKVIPLSLSENQKVNASEGSTQQSIDHPNVAKVIEYFFTVVQNKKCLCVALELCDTSLYPLLIRRTHFPVMQVISWFLQLLEALREIHHLGLIHRDIKPGNILVKANPSAPGMFDLKITDFGVAKVLDNTVHAVTATGTPSYQAPEMLSETPYDNRVDIWSLGLIFLQCAESFDRVDPLTLKMLRMYFLPNASAASWTEGTQLRNSLASDPAVRAMVSHMICPVHERRTAEELLRNPIVTAWRAVLTKDAASLKSIVQRDPSTLGAMATALRIAVDQPEYVDMCIRILKDLIADPLLKTHICKLPEIQRNIVELVAELVSGMSTTNDSMTAPQITSINSLLEILHECWQMTPYLDKPAFVHYLIRQGLTTALFNKIIDLPAGVALLIACVRFSPSLMFEWANQNLLDSMSANPPLSTATLREIPSVMLPSVAPALPTEKLTRLFKGHLTPNVVLRVLERVHQPNRRVNIARYAIPFLVRTVRAEAEQSRERLSVVQDSRELCVLIDLLRLYVEDIYTALRACSALRICTDVATRRMPQLTYGSVGAFACLTCWPNQERERELLVGVCTACAHTCHKGHSIIPAWVEGAFCCQCYTASKSEGRCRIRSLDSGWDYSRSPSICAKSFAETNAKISWDTACLKAFRAYSPRGSARINIAHSVPESAGEEKTTMAYFRTDTPLCFLEWAIQPTLRDFRTIVYFEIEILRAPEDNNIVVGLAMSACSRGELIRGKPKGAILYSALDGNVVYYPPKQRGAGPAAEPKRKTAFGPLYSVPDVVGCGVTMSGHVFFTKNGLLVGVYEEVRLSQGEAIYGVLGCSTPRRNAQDLQFITYFGGPRPRPRPFEFQFGMDEVELKKQVALPPPLVGAADVLRAERGDMLLQEILGSTPPQTTTARLCARVLECVQYGGNPAAIAEYASRVISGNIAASRGSPPIAATPANLVLRRQIISDASLSGNADAAKAVHEGEDEEERMSEEESPEQSIMRAVPVTVLNERIERCRKQMLVAAAQMKFEESLRMQAMITLLEELKHEAIDAVLPTSSPAASLPPP